MIPYWQSVFYRIIKTLLTIINQILSDRQCAIVLLSATRLLKSNNRDIIRVPRITKTLIHFNGIVELLMEKNLIYYFASKQVYVRSRIFVYVEKREPNVN